MDDKAKNWLRNGISMGLALATHKEKIADFYEKVFDREENRLKLEEWGEKVLTFGRMLKLYFKGKYHDISPWMFVNTAIGILYLSVNADLIPDKISTLGFVDDVAVLAWVVSTFAKEIERFEEWEAMQEAGDIALV